MLNHFGIRIKFFISTVLAFWIIKTEGIHNPLDAFDGINVMDALADYCNKFNEILKPYICRAINFPSTSSTTEDPRWWPNATEWWEEDCSCDLNCSTGQQNSDESNSEENNDYSCSTCGSECPVNTTRPTRCTCAVLGRFKKSRCKCTANCATFRYGWGDDDDDDAPSTSCIFNINNLNNGIFANSNPDYSCECTKSKSAENNTNPDFVCVCQPTN